MSKVSISGSSDRPDPQAWPKPWRVPPSWTWVKSKEVANIVGGGTPRTDDSRNFQDGEIAWITPADLSGYTEKRIKRGARNITQAGLEGSGARLIPADSVLFSSRAPIGYVAIAANTLSTNQGFKSFVPSAALDPDYLYYYLQRARELAIAAASGTTFLEISGKKTAELPIVIAPILEQRRIVGAIEVHFSRLEAAIAALKRVRANLKRYRASLLLAAAEGRLPDSEARSLTMEGELPDGWSQPTLGELLREPLRNGLTTRPSPDGSGIRTLTLTAVTTGDFSVENTKPTSIPPKMASDLWLEPGDILIERANTAELVGTCALYSGPKGFAIYPDMVIRARVRREVSPEFITFMLQSPPSRAYFQAKAKGVAGNMPKIDQGTIESVRIPLPPIADQLRIASEIQRRLSVLDEISVETNAGVESCARLYRSILKRAFEGRLVPQDPIDEPAEALLERTSHQRLSRAPSDRESRVLRTRRRAD
jgi:type I restriction enzyme, S subunit